MHANALSYGSDVKTKLLLVCGAIAGPLFTIAWMVEGFSRPNYDALRHPISSLSIGAMGWTQALNFIVTGLLTVGFAFGLRPVLQAWGEKSRAPLLIAMVGVGLIGAGLFVTDPMNGYPVGTPALPLEYTVVGRLHRLFSALVFLGLPFAGFGLARLFAKRGEPTWAIYSRATDVAFLIMFILTSMAFGQVDGLSNYAGLFQRITLTIGWAWLTLLSIYMLNVSDKTRMMEKVAERKGI